MRKAEIKGPTVRNAQNVKIIPTTTVTAVNSVPPVEAGEVDYSSHC